MPISSWSTTASDNDDADLGSGIDLREGEAPGQINDSIRALMAVLKSDVALKADTVLQADAALKTDFANSLAGSGYQKLPGGLIIQWGLVTKASDDTIAFPIAFPNALILVVPSVNVLPTGGQLFGVNWDTGTRFGFNVRIRYAQNGGLVTQAGGVISWIAIGT